MSGVISYPDTFAEFKVIASRTNEPTVMYVPTELLIHSAYDPMREARQIVEGLSLQNNETVVLLGGGFGYLAEAIYAYGGGTSRVHVLEPDAGLWGLCRRNRSNSVYMQSENIQISLASSLSSLTGYYAKIGKETRLVVAPYFQRLSLTVKHPLSGFIQMLRAEQASASVYESLLSIHESQNKLALSRMPFVLDNLQKSTKTVMVIGAGPSLDQSVASIKANRERLLLIAVSGAVPTLCTYGIQPDWVVALEAKSIVCKDLSFLQQPTRILVFPSTNPDAIGLDGQQYYNGSSEAGQSLETRGGTSAVPALDFALRGSDSAIILVGLDLSNQQGAYASFSNRDNGSAPTGSPTPKYQAMRNALERVIYNHDAGSMNRRIFHVLLSGEPLAGAERIQPAQLNHLLEIDKTAGIHYV